MMKALMVGMTTLILGSAVAEAEPVALTDTQMDQVAASGFDLAVSYARYRYNKAVGVAVAVGPNAYAFAYAIALPYGSAAVAVSSSSTN